MTYDQMMKEKAFNEEYGFTGIYTSNYREYRKGSGKSGSEAIKEEKKRPEFKGYKMRIKREDCGVSLYIEKRFFKDKRIKDLENKINTFENRKANLYEKYINELKALETENEEYILELNELKK